MTPCQGGLLELAGLNKYDIVMFELDRFAQHP